jgi:hypothetical protein
MSEPIDEENALLHYGIKRRSGRYPWGSGEDEETRSRDFLGMVATLRKEGMTDAEIAKGFGMNSSEFRATTTIARNSRAAADIAFAQRLRDKGMSNGAIAERMGFPGESSVRALLDPNRQARTDKLQDLATLLRDQVDSKDVVDVGIGVEHYVDTTRTQLDTAIAILKSEGYSYMNVQIDQATGPNKTTTKVLAKPGIDYKTVVQNKEMIQPLSFNKKADGTGYEPIKAPLSISSKRVGIKYAEEGGTDADGVIYVRPGVKDTDLGGNHYAQVRIAVDGTHYIKGMAVYKDDLPDGIDLQFNTNKSNTGNKLDALKPLKTDPETGKPLQNADAFGSQIKRQILGLDDKPTSVANLVNEEGDWDDWSKSLASQMLSKQTPTLAKEQLGKTYADKRRDLDEIMALNNPAVKRKLLEGYADDVDSSSVHLQAKALPRQRTQVILPVKDLKTTEVYAPNFREGERVVLIRYPHGGTFEIPELTVTHSNPSAKKLIGPLAKDAIGIHPKVAEKLSGADFDGDSVLVIPNNEGKVKSKASLKALEDFDPKASYPAFEGMPKMSAKAKQTEMGKVSNLITDMTIKGANDAEIARAVRHSMVVIDAEKHNLNYKQSAVDNNISQLKEKYQGGATRGSTTIISRTTSEARVAERKNWSLNPNSVNPLTGEKIYRETGAGYENAKGQYIEKHSKSTKGAEARDAHTITSAYDSKGNRVGDALPIERVYADHSNRLKGLANEARKEWVATKSIPYSPSANKTYADTVAKLNAQLNVALKNAPRERQAQLLASAIIKAKKDADPTLTPDQIKKESAKALINARARVGAKKVLVQLDERAWEAIQAGAISNNMLEKILDNTDIDVVKALATPRQNTVMTSGKKAQAQALFSSGKTAAEVADILGVPVSTLKSSMSEEDE